MKSPFLIGLAGDIEASYNSGGVVAPATQGIMLAEGFELNIERGFDGSRSGPPGRNAHQRRVPPSGARATGTIPIEPKGAGVAYSASVFPVAHALRRAAGFTATVTTTPGSEKWVYKPTSDPAAAASGFFDGYAYGEKYPLTGLLADWSIGADGPVVPIEKFMFKAILGAVDDAAVAPTLAYPFPTISPIVSQKAGLFTFGLFTGAILRKWEIRRQRSIEAITNQNVAGGDAGYRAGKDDFVIDVTVETPAKAVNPYHAAATIDVKRLYETGTELAWSIALGSTQYNRRTFSGSKAQVMSDPKTTADGNTTVTQFTLQPNESADGACDEVIDTWD